MKSGLAIEKILKVVTLENLIVKNTIDQYEIVTQKF